MAPSVTGVFAFLKHCGVLASGFATDADVKQAVTSWLPTLDTVILRPDTSYIATVGKMLKCQWLLRGSPMCSFCCPCATYTQKSDKRSWRQSFLTSFFKISLNFLQNLANNLQYSCRFCKCKQSYTANILTLIHILCSVTIYWVNCFGLVHVGNSLLIWHVQMLHWVKFLNIKKINTHSLVNKNHKVSICIDIQSEHNYVILSGIIQHINYMFRPLLGHHQVVPSLQSNCIT